MGKDLHPGPSAWPAGGGEMGARVRAFDWEKTPLGPISSWPQSLKTTIDLMMASQLAMNLIWGPERILIYNEIHRAFMGTKHPRAFGRPGREVWGEVWEAAEAAIHRRVFAGETVTLEDRPWTLLRNGGPEEAFFTSYFTPIHDETGAVVANLAIAFETTNAVREKAERDRAERALRKNEARLREVLEGIGEAFYTLDQNQRFLFASRKALEIWDKKPDDLIGLPFLSAFPNAVGTPDYEAHRRAFEAGTAQHFESLSPLIGHWFEVDIYPTSTGVSVAFRDIHRRKHAEALLRASEARLKAAVELVGLSSYSGDPRTGALDWDARLKAMWGLPADTIVDAPMAVAAIHPDDQARVAAAWEASLDPASDGVFVAEYRVLGIEDGVERWIATRGQTNFENDVPVSVFGVALEITDRKRIERRLERRVEERTRELEETNQQLRAQMEQREIAQAESQQLQRLDEIGQITSGVAHDFNNLLSIVLTNARMLSRNLRDDPGDQEGIELVLGAAERGANLTSQLLAFSRQQRLEPQVVDLNSTIVNMGGLLNASLCGAIQLRTNLAMDLCPALVDPIQIQSVILNLVINARDAMPSGGTLTVETFNTIIGKELSGPAAPAPGKYVGLAIRDTGMGIPDDVLPRVFEPFFTTKGPGKGSGLGLAQVLGFAKQSGGGIALKTHVGEGTSVTVFLPCAEVVPRVRERESGAEQISTVELKPCILVVDDDRAVLRSTVRVLEALGYAAVPAASGQEALELIANGLKIELVLADFAMPEMTGVELAKAICATDPNLPVILVTGYGDRETLEEFREAQILRKPYDEDGLMKAILTALT
ncbi:response regulator [Bradyrhizobium sp. UFLA05-153]